jgi:hypothetical protein
MPSRPRSARRSRLLALAVLALLLGAIAFMATVMGVTSLASSPPATSTTTAPATTDVPPTTTAAAAVEDGYQPNPAGPPATDASGQWTTKTAPASPGAGGDR